MSIYNHEMLNQRLRRENTPVMFVGQSSALASRTVNSKHVVFAIDIESAKPEEEVIVGIRVELTDSYRPQFLSVSWTLFSLPSLPLRSTTASTTSKPRRALTIATTAVRSRQH